MLVCILECKLGFFPCQILSPSGKIVFDLIGAINFCFRKEIE